MSKDRTEWLHKTSNGKTADFDISECQSSPGAKQARISTLFGIICPYSSTFNRLKKPYKIKQHQIRNAILNTMCDIPGKCGQRTTVSATQAWRQRMSFWP